MKKLRHSYALDDKDITIIRMLSEAGRAKDRELAQAIGTSRVRARLVRKVLEDAGVIKVYRAVIDWNKVAENGYVMKKIREEMENEKSTDGLH